MHTCVSRQLNNIFLKLHTKTMIIKTIEKETESAKTFKQTRLLLSFRLERCYENPQIERR